MSAPTNNLFCAAINRVLNSWTVLKLAVSHGFGGADSQEKAEWMVYAIDKWFSENAGIESYELEDFLADVLNAEFDTVADDGSLKEIAQMICGMYKLCEAGDEAGVHERLKNLPSPAVASSQQQEVNQDVDSEEENGMEPDPPPASLASLPQAEQNKEPDRQPEADNQSSGDTNAMETDDGWQFVGKKGKKR